jgi:hypothetical protein
MGRPPDVSGGRHRLRDALGYALEQGIITHVPRGVGILVVGLTSTTVLAAFLMAEHLSPDSTVSTPTPPALVAAAAPGGAAGPTAGAASGTRSDSSLVTREIDSLTTLPTQLSVTLVTVRCPLRRGGRRVVDCVYTLEQFVGPIGEASMQEVDLRAVRWALQAAAVPVRCLPRTRSNSS